MRLIQRVERSGANSAARPRCSRSIDWTGEPEPHLGLRRALADETITARRVILAVGGCSYPGCGTTGDGYSIARRFGHTIVEPRPALVPLRVDAEWVPGLRGLSVPDALVSVVAGTTVLASRREAVLFTHRGLSGPAILDVSRAAARRGESDALTLRLDLQPDLPREELDRRLQAECRQGRRAVISLLPDTFPRGSPNACSRSRRYRPIAWGRTSPATNDTGCVGALKELSLPIAGTLGFEKAEVTSGGVALARSRSEDAREPAGPRPLLRGRDPRPRRPDRRL